jgi:hypothetical protein
MYTCLNKGGAMYQIVNKRKLLLDTNKYLKPGEYLITKNKKPVLKIIIEECREINVQEFKTT